MQRRILIFVILGLILSACGTRQLEPSAEPQTVVVSQAETTAPLATPVVATRTPLPPTATPTPTITPTKTPTPTATLHPLSIEWLRERDYPASEIVIEETLANGPNYNRYIASYELDGLKINALLTVPYGEKPETGWPVIIFNHGYIPPDQYRTTERYVAYVDGFARSDYIVFRSDYRGHADLEGTPRGAYSAPDYIVDILNAVEAMKTFPEADPERIGMWGHSMGGFITLRSMVTSPDIKAGVIWAGVVASYPDLFTKWRRSDSSTPPTPRPGSWRTRIGLTLSDENIRFLDSISANAFLDDLSGPVQLHHGTADTSVPIEFSETLYDQIQAIDGEVEYYEYDGDNHNLSNLFTQAMIRSIAFFDEYVK